MDGTPETTAALLATLPPLPDIVRPLLQAEQVARGVASGNTRDLADMMSGRYLDYMLDEVLAALPDVREHIATLGKAGLVLQARPSNTINALMIPTPDGVVIVFNLGLYGMLFSFSRAIARVVATGDMAEAAHRLADVVDWASSRAKEPRTMGADGLDDDPTGLAANLASRAQRFTLCHELGHVITFNRTERAARTASIGGVVVNALQDSWDKEYAADRDGLGLYLRVLASQRESAAAALIGAEVFLNAASMVQESSADESQAHPPAEERIARVRREFTAALGDRAAEESAPANAVRKLLETLKVHVRHEVQRRRTLTTAQFMADLHASAAQAPRMTQEETRAAAKRLSRYVLDSPGATLDCLHDVIFAPLASDEPNTGSPTRVLALNAALHLEKPLQEAIGLQRLGLGSRRSS